MDWTISSEVPKSKDMENAQRLVSPILCRHRLLKIIETVNILWKI